MQFEFATAARIVCGRACVSQLARIARELGGSRLLVVTGKNAARTRSILDQLTTAGCRTSSFNIAGEPTLDIVREGAGQARRCDLVIAMGGGSAIDAGKALAALLTNTGDPLDYLEVIGAASRWTLRPRRSSPFPPLPARVPKSPAMRCWHRPNMA